MLDYIKEKKDQFLTKVLCSNDVMGFLNKKIQQYGTIKNIIKNKNGLHVDLEIIGLSETFSVSVKEICFDQDFTSVTLKGVSCNIEGINNVVADYLEGKSFDIPESERQNRLLPLLAKFI